MALNYAIFYDAESDFGGGSVVTYNAETSKYRLTTRRLEPNSAIVSNSYGWVIGYDEHKQQCAVTIAGTVEVRPVEPISEFKAGDAVCSGPDGFVSLMTHDEVNLYPESVIGYVLGPTPKYEYVEDEDGETISENQVASETLTIRVV